MKKVLCVVLSLALIILLCSCDTLNTESNIFSQEVTIIKMPSPPQCKNSNKITVVDEVIEVLGLIEKSPYTMMDEKTNGWEIMVKINVDGKELVYTIGDVFTDADGSQYYVENLDEIKEKLNTIYDKIDIPEVEYK